MSAVLLALAATVSLAVSIKSRHGGTPADTRHRRYRHVLFMRAAWVVTAVAAIVITIELFATKQWAAVLIAVGIMIIAVAQSVGIWRKPSKELSTAQQNISDEELHRLVAGMQTKVEAIRAIRAVHPGLSLSAASQLAQRVSGN
ncbi:hypothetical protein LQL77_31250 [Rhodococcus cerastii]|nr:hypothetical protein [Rhodococcus cerastii]